MINHYYKSNQSLFNKIKNNTICIANKKDNEKSKIDSLFKII